MAINKYIDLITSEHKTRTKFINWLSVPLDILDDGINVLNQMNSAFDLEVAIGQQQDRLGVLIGRSRQLHFQPSDGSSPLMDDSTYGRALKAKIAQNQWDGTIPKIYELWGNVLPDLKLSILDNQDMTMTALVEGQIDSKSQQLISNNLIIPKPAGVGLNNLALSKVDAKYYFGALVTTADSITVSMIKPATELILDTSPLMGALVTTSDSITISMLKTVGDLIINTNQLSGALVTTTDLNILTLLH